MTGLVPEDSRLYIADVSGDGAVSLDEEGRFMREAASATFKNSGKGRTASGDQVRFPKTISCEAVCGNSFLRKQLEAVLYPGMVRPDAKSGAFDPLRLG